MLTFNDHVTNAPPPLPNKHLSHLEDMVFDGPQGVKLVHELLAEFGKVLDGDVSTAMNVSTKWDGSPAVLFGPDPADGVFFVGTKAVFNKLPKAAKTHDDINAMYEGPVATILHQCLDELPKLKPDKILMGDILFSRALPEDEKGGIRLQVIGGQPFQTFQPNTILYAVDADSKLGAAVAGAKLGIALHTALSGTGTIIGKYGTKSISPLTYVGLTKDPNVVTVDAHFDDVSGTVTFTAQERADFQLAHEQTMTAFEALDMRVFDLLQNLPAIRTNLGLFVNYRVRKGLSGPASAEDFLRFQGKLRNRHLDRMKTSKGWDKVMHHYTTLDVSATELGLDQLFQVHNAVQVAKNIILQKLNQTATIRHFLPTADGYKVTGPEGFVAISHSGQAVKLVDRLEFSRANFQSRQWS